MNLDEFGTLMQIRAQKLTGNVVQAKKDVALAVLTSVVQDTPVDKGVAKSNWQVGIGEAITSTRGAFSPGELGSTSQENETAAISEGSQTIASVGLGTPIHITNNLSYIQELNEGSSKQAPAGFVQNAALRASEAIKSIKVIKD